ncbi:unnamed protein product [Coffea canephora]|uniref:DYW domain-containing protein n=1 Tax=Coffea canephora TaxID=49390 RepID=A0A068UWG4_COFCA|nr:unnamed protein product [Coffea canephora]
MAFTLPDFPARTITTKTATILQVPDNPKTLILEKCRTTRDLNQVHAHLIKTRLLHNPNVANPLLESAALLLPNPSINYALNIFRDLEKPDSAAYNAMIRGLTLKQSSNEAILFFRQMIEHLVKPDKFSFSSVLKACSRLKALMEGQQIHAQIFKCQWSCKHEELVNNALVYMYASCGEMVLARRVFDGMSERSTITWNSMFSGYVKSGFWEEWIDDYVEVNGLMGNANLVTSLFDIQANRGKDALSLFHEMQKANVEPNEVTMVTMLSSCALLGALETGKWVHSYIKKKNLHPDLEDIYTAIDHIMKRIKLAGYVPNTAEGRLDAEEDGKEASISHHSEKLAIAFGLLKTTPGATIRISKNLRICTDCHNAAKLISTVFDRVLVIRDRNRFHHFAGGTCSCNDFW